MTEIERWSGWIGRAMVGPSGGQLGQIVDVYVDEQTNQAEWATIATIARNEVRFVPLRGARAEVDTLVVPWDHATVEAAPTLPYDGALTEEDEAELYRHYGLTRSDVPTLEGVGTGVASADQSTSVPTAASAPAASTPTTAPGVAVTRSEEELRVSKVPREAGRVRLRKWVETEDVSHVVPVTHEEVRVERQPVNAANVDEALAEAQLSETEYEVVLHEEEVVAAKVTVPKERVRVEKTVVTEEQPIEDSLRKERVDIERDDVVS